MVDQTEEVNNKKTPTLVRGFLFYLLLILVYYF